MSDRPANAGFFARLRSDLPQAFERRIGRQLVTAALGLMVTGLCMLTVRSGRVGDVELSVFRAINELSDALRVPMWIFQVFGSLALVALAAAVALASRRYRLGMALATAIPFKLAMEWWLVKALVERKRPVFTVAGAIIRDANTSPLGFPSGHAIFAFALAGIVAPYVGRRGTIVVYTLAILNSLARVYLGAHNPLDVVAGAALGVAIAAGLNLVVGTPRDHVQIQG